MAWQGFRNEFFSLAGFAEVLQDAISKVLAPGRSIPREKRFGFKDEVSVFPLSAPNFENQYRFSLVIRPPSCAKCTFEIDPSGLWQSRVAHDIFQHPHIEKE